MTGSDSIGVKTTEGCIKSPLLFLLCVQLEYEPASFSVACVQCQASVHLGSYQGTDRQSQSVSFRQVFNLRERFEQVLLFSAGIPVPVSEMMN